MVVGVVRLRRPEREAIRARVVEEVVVADHHRRFRDRCEAIRANQGDLMGAGDHLRRLRHGYGANWEVRVEMVEVEGRVVEDGRCRSVSRDVIRREWV